MIKGNFVLYIFFSFKSFCFGLLYDFNVMKVFWVEKKYYLKIIKIYIVFGSL